MNRKIEDDILSDDNIRDFAFYVMLTVIGVGFSILLQHIIGNIIISILLPIMLYVYVAYKKEKKRKNAKRIEENW